MNNIKAKIVGDMKSQIKIILLIILSLVILSACIPGNGYNTQERFAGFWMGVWHGVIAPISFFVSIFYKDIRIYEIFNKGIMYDLGFLIGLWCGVLHGLSALIIDKKRPCVKNKPQIKNIKCAKFIIFGFRFCLETCEKYRNKGIDETLQDDKSKVTIKILAPEILEKIKDLNE